MYTFTTRIERLTDSARHHYVPVPAEVVAAIKGKGARRVIATINGLELKRALTSRKYGPTFLILGQPYLRQLGLQLGDPVSVQLMIDEEPDRVDLAEELQAVLDTDDEAALLFRAMTPGMQRSINIYVEQAKHTDTRIKRALELAQKMKAGTLNSQRNKP